MEVVFQRKPCDFVLIALRNFGISESMALRTVIHRGFMLHMAEGAVAIMRGSMRIGL